jgi:hypothetical protein
VRDLFTGPTPAQARAMLAEQAATGVPLPEKIIAKLRQLGYTD